jgi:hypothetical protein
LVDRYALRCASYDRQRLRDMTDGKKNAENILVAEMARYLFDQGLSPMISPRIGGLEPDAFQQFPEGSFYLEAKQYDSAEAARRVVPQGFHQVIDTSAVIRGMGLREVFLAIFRRDGPHCDLPDEVRVNGLVILPIVIHIAATARSGSNQKEPAIVFNEADVLRPAKE